MICESYHNVKFLQFHVDWIIVLDEEYFHLVLQYIRSETCENINMLCKVMVKSTDSASYITERS